MKYDLFIKTLERGVDIGLGTKFNISDILSEEFSKPTSADRGIWKAECEIQFDILRDMQYKLNIIKFDANEVNNIHWWDAEPEPCWFDNALFNVWVTVTGLDYLNQYRLRQSNFSLNGILESNTKLQTGFDQVIASNSNIQAIASRRQTRIFRWTALFALGAMGIAGISLWSDFRKDKLLQQLSQKDSLIHVLQKKLYRLKIDSSLSLRSKENLPKKK